MGVDCETVTPARRSAPGRRRLLDLVEGDRETTVLFYAGRLAPEKNSGLLLDTAARLDPEHYRLAIAGGGTLLENLKRECVARGLGHVVFLGHVPHRETLADYYANADIFLHPNAREPFGIAPLEAMASGLPLVVPNRGGVMSYADASNAWLADDNPVSFGETVKCVEAQVSERVRRATAARGTAERHRWHVVTARYLEIFRELHALTQGRPAAIPARTWSTPGNLFGRELVAKL
jgi:alpha-1,6-mannosyltransferase